MQQSGPSRTAIWTATQRAVHQLLDPESKILNDPFARAFAGYDSDEDLLQAVDSLEPPITALSRLHFALRQRYVEDELALARERGINQFVILGAGLDSFAYRCPKTMAAVTIFEVDHPATQAWKRARVAQLCLEPRANLRHLAIDFERQLLGEGLAEGGVDLSAPVFISCLGVTQYLTKDVMHTMLRDIAATAAAGSELVLQFIPPLQTTSADDARGISRVLAHFATIGEPWLSFYTPAEIDDHLRQAGFRDIVHFAAEQAAERYLRDYPDGPRLPPSFRMVSAGVG